VSAAAGGPGEEPAKAPGILGGMHMNTSTAREVEALGSEIRAVEQKRARVIKLSEEDLQAGKASRPAFSYAQTTVDDAGVQATEAFEQQPARIIPKKPLGYRFVKRAFDIVFSTGVIVVGFVPGLVLSALIVADTKGTPIYSSTRIGRGGKPFRMYKFRSMVADSDDLEKYFTPGQLAEWHQEHKVDNDPRITKLGAFIRETSVDEIPQFINVLLGQISIIGPRVITEEEVGYFGEDRDLLLSVPPGITGMWQTGPRNLATFESGLRQKLELAYVNNASLRLDASIVAKTIRTMIERTGK